MHLEVQERRRVLTESWHQLLQRVINCHFSRLSLHSDFYFIQEMFSSKFWFNCRGKLIHQLSCYSFLISCSIISHTGSRAPRDSLLTQRSLRRNWTDFQFPRDSGRVSAFSCFFRSHSKNRSDRLQSASGTAQKMKKFRWTETQMRARFLLSLFAESNRARAL